MDVEQWKTFQPAVAYAPQMSRASLLGLQQQDNLEHALAGRLKEAAMTQAEFSLARMCLKELMVLAEQVGQGWRVRPFGSLCNGFAVRGSDFDVTCCDEDRDSNSSALQMLEDLLALCSISDKFEVVDVIKGAMVPILKVRFQQILDVDVSFRNVAPLRNSQLLRGYSELDTCVRDLVVMVKLWAKAAGVCGAGGGHLSAYSFTLMAIYFLQVESDIRMPCLDTALFTGEGKSRREAKTTQWSCSLRKTDLLYRFFYFFTSVFEWGTEVVSVRLGCRVPTMDPRFEQLRGRTEQRMHIEDPFVVGRNLHCVLRVDHENTLYERLCQAAQALQHGEAPPGLTCSPLGGDGGARGWGAELGSGLVACAVGAPPPPAGVSVQPGAGAVPMAERSGGHAGTAPSVASGGHTAVSVDAAAAAQVAFAQKLSHLRRLTVGWQKAAPGVTGGGSVDVRVLSGPLQGYHHSEARPGSTPAQPSDFDAPAPHEVPRTRLLQHKLAAF